MAEYWFILAVGSTFLNGLRSFFTKYFVDRGMSSRGGMLLPPAVMVLLSVPFVWMNASPVATNLFFMAAAAAIQGALFYLASLCRWEGLREGTPAYILFPIAQGSAPLIVLLSAVLFNEWATIRQPAVACGIVMSVAATCVLAQWHAGGIAVRRGVLLAVVAMFASAGATLAAKYAFEASQHLNVFGFILVSNSIGIALATLQSAHAREGVRLTRQDWLRGIVLGALNFGGLVLFLEAMRWGELSLVASIGALSLLVPILLASLIQKERLGLRQQAALWLSLLSLLLLATAPR